MKFKKATTVQFEDCDCLFYRPIVLHAAEGAETKRVVLF